MIRKATASDIPVILDMYEKGLIELGATDISESMLLKKVVNSYHLAPCFLLVINGIVEGMAGLTAVTSSHNGVATLNDYMFYVNKEHRNIDNLGGLVKEIKKFAKDVNMPIKLEFLSNNDLELKKRVLEMHGFSVFSVTGVYNG